MSPPSQTNCPSNAEAAPPRYAGRKRPHALTTMVVYDPAAAELRTSAASLSLSGALVPFLAPPIDAVPLSAVPVPRAEPAWIRAHFGIRLDLKVHFIDDKAVTATDLDPQQNRLRLPTAGVLRSLRPILSPKELQAASIPREGEKEAPRRRRQPPTTQDQEEEQGRITKRKKKQGKKHGGLPVIVCNAHAGTKALQLTRWESSHGNIIKGEGYLDFITRCDFKEKDVVEIWAFKEERHIRLFGVDIHASPPLYLVLSKKQQQPAAFIGTDKCTSTSS